MEFYSVVAFFQKGGMFMYPILLVFAVGMAIAFERWVQLNRIRSANHKMWNRLLPILTKGEFEKARDLVNKDKSAVSQMLGMGLARQGAVRRREDIEIAMEESMMEIIPQLEKRTPVSDSVRLCGRHGDCGRTLVTVEPRPGREPQGLEYASTHTGQG